MKTRFTPRRFAAVVAAAGLTVIVIPEMAQASVPTSCSFDAGTATVTAVVGTGADVTLERSGDAIWFGEAPCGVADVTNTDLIKIDAPNDAIDESLTVSLAGGQFAPGATAEADGSNEIEISVLMWDDALTVQGSDGPDSILQRGSAVDLTSATGPREYEIFPAGSSYLSEGTLRVNGGNGNDTVALDCPNCVAYGDAGNDTLFAGLNGGIEYDGGPGEDVVSLANISPANLQVTAPGAADLSFGSVTPGHIGVHNVERYEGGADRDQFIGAAGSADVFVGNGGNDIFRPLGGDDTIDAGDGIDEIFASEGSPVVVDMTAQTIDGNGHDKYSGVEAIEGSVNDDTFVGDPTGTGLFYIDGVRGRDLLDLRSAANGQRVSIGGSNQWGYLEWVSLFEDHIRKIYGSQQRDRIVVNGSTQVRAHLFGFGGDDSLVGGSYHDVLAGGGGDDRLNGQQGQDICDGGPGTDRIEHCEA
jgi:Ca2+-binding RTX toxin-like protein